MPNIPALPTITSISATDPTVTDAGTVHYTITFSESVTGVTADQFSLVTTGTLLGSGVVGVTPVAGSNGASYVVSVSSGTGDGTLALQLTGGNVRDGDGYSLGPFQSETQYSTGGYVVALGDINGDGRADLVAGGGYTASHGYLRIMLNSGTGALEAPTLIDLPTSSVSSIALGDVNGDGKLDLLYGRSNSAALGVRLGNGDGTFGTETSFAVGRSPAEIVVADFNGDGRADVIVANEDSRTVSVLVGNGDGTFNPQTTYAVGDTPYIPYGYVTTGDFNGDGKLDLAVLGDSRVSVLLGNGDGTFQPRTSYGSGAPGSIVSGDFNGDGKIDLATLSSGSINIMIGQGNGGFAAPQLILMPAGGAALGGADVNGDGNFDLVASNGSGLSILYGLGNGTFRAPVTLPSIGSSMEVSFADLNGDGKPDIVVAAGFSNNMIVLLSDPSNSAAPSYTIHRPAPTLAITSDAVTLGTDGNNYINAAHFNGGATTLAGVASAGALVKVTNAFNGSVVGTVTAGVDGAWALNVSSLQDGSTYGYVASTTDGAGNQLAGPVLTFTVDKTAPIVSIIDIEPVDGTGKFNVIGSIGQGDAGAPVIINQQFSSALGGAISNADGSWVLANQTLDSNAFGHGVLSVQATDAAGNTGSSGWTDLRIGGSMRVSINSSTKYIVIGNYGLQVAFLGTVTGARVAPGASVLIDAGGTAIDTKLWSGALEINRGTSIGSVILSGAVQHVYGTATGATVAAGGYHDISGTATNTALSGDEQVLAGGIATHTVIEASGRQYVAAGGISKNTVVHGLQYVAAGGNDTGATIDGVQYLMGTATSATVSAGGIQYHFGSSTGTLVGNGGIQHVYGGNADGTQVAAGGYQDVTDATVTNTVLAGNQQVLGNGVAVATTIEAGGRQYVGSGGATSSTLIKTGGLQYVDAGGSDSGAVIEGGFQYVAGTATGVTVSGGGEQDVGAGGTATDTHLVDGSEHVIAGGRAQGIDFGGDAAATLVLDSPDGLAGSIANWGEGDRIDFRNTTVSSFDIDSSNHLTITTAGGDTYSWDLLTQYSVSSFVLAADGLGGTVLSYEPPATLLAASH